jgi:signal transduction histidine kinase
VSLRQRLALTLVLVAIPLVYAVGFIRAELVRRSEADVLRELVLSRAAGLGRERCEAEPEELFAPPRGGRGHRPGRPPWEGSRHGGPPDEPPGAGPPGGEPRGPRRPPVQAFAYDEAFRSADPAAPPFPDELRRALEAGSDHATRRVASDADPGAPGPTRELEVAVRTGWKDGRCAVILARRFEPPPPPLLARLGDALPLLLALLAAVFVATGPVVHRIRALAADVRRSADTRYETPVPERGRDEVALLAQAFNDAGRKVKDHLSKLEERDRTLRDLLSNTTHDLMIPLTVLLGHLSAFRKSAAEGETIDEARLLPAIQEGQYIASLVHNLGAAARLEAADVLVERHPVDLNALVERVVERHRPVAAPAGIAIEYGVPEHPVTVTGDVTLVEQAVSNLVHNAVRYNRRGGHVAVLLEESAGRFRLRVEDDGPGVPEAERARLFERRHRGDGARQRDPGGLGLGLHIARGVAERHGFALRLASSEHGGLAVELEGATAAGGDS